MTDSTPKVLAIIQARMSATRLPDKVLADIHGRPMLRWLLDRLAAVKTISQTVIATTTNPADDLLAEWCRREGVACFRGSEQDVLERFYLCAKQHGADIVVRVTADDPLKDPGVIELALSRLLGNPTLDYCSNTLKPTYPEGVDIEVFRFSALEKAHTDAKLDSEREHVTPYIWKHPGLFEACNIEFERDLSHWRWTVDKPRDLEFMRQLLSHFTANPLASLSELVAFLEANPQLTELCTNHTVRNEGYLKSISLEQK